jgi:uroporphyrinogen-III synthase
VICIQHKTLAGKKVLVTRAEHQVAELNRLIIANEGVNINFPVIDVKASKLSERENIFLQQLESFEFIFFISVNAVNFALPAINGKIERLRKMQVVAVGQATADALAEKGITNVLRPKRGFNSEAILAMVEFQSLPKTRCLIIRGDSGRELLATSLRERGALVDYVEVYQKSLAAPDTRDVCMYLLNDEFAAILIYSAVALHNLLVLLAKDNIKKHLLRTPIVVISQRVYLAAKKIGFTEIIIAVEASDAAMVNALLNGEACG